MKVLLFLLILLSTTPKYIFAVNDSNSTEVTKEKIIMTKTQRENHLNKSNEKELKTLKSCTNPNNIFSIIEELTSEKYKGRLIGTKENELVEDYIALYFKEIGLKNFKGLKNYKHFFKHNSAIINKQPVFKIQDKDKNLIEEFKFLMDFNMFTECTATFSTINGEISGELYFLNDYEDFKPNNKKLDGKIVLIPKNFGKEHYEYLWVNSTLLTETLKNAKAIVREFYPDTVKNGLYCLYNGTKSDDKLPNKGPIFINTNSTTFKKLVEYSKDKTTLGYIKVNHIVDTSAANIVGVIPGSAEKLKDEYIIISSHFDHLGFIFNGPYFPGALDNASGVATMMEIARVLQEKNVQPKKTIIFIAFNGEEMGLLGSEAFVKEYKKELKKATVINLDMIGHKNPNPIRISFAEENVLVSEIEELFKTEGLQYTQWESKRADHVSFSDMGIPAVSLIEYEQTDYHQPSDTMDKLVEGDFVHIINIIYNYICKNGF